jgi:hypothetical protein
MIAGWRFVGAGACRVALDGGSSFNLVQEDEDVEVVPLLRLDGDEWVRW